jgi:hypothetical protein
MNVPRNMFRPLSSPSPNMLVQIWRQVDGDTYHPGDSGLHMQECSDR